MKTSLPPHAVLVTISEPVNDWLLRLAGEANVRPDQIAAWQLEAARQVWEGRQPQTDEQKETACPA